MNTQLAISLAEAVSALLPEDLKVFQEALLGSMIKKTPGVSGGYACIRNTRITVWALISLANQGAADEELLMDFPGLTTFDLWVAQAYYQLNQAEIDELIAAHHTEDDWDNV